MQQVYIIMMALQLKINLDNVSQLNIHKSELVINNTDALSHISN